MLDVKFAYHSTPRSRSERHGNAGASTGPVRGKFSNRQQQQTGYGMAGDYDGGASGGYSQYPQTGQAPLNVSAMPQQNPLAMAGLQGNVLSQMQVLAQVQQMANALGPQTAPAVQQLAYLLQLQQQLNQTQQPQPGQQTAQRAPMGGVGSAGVSGAQSYQPAILSQPQGNGGLGPGNYGVY